MQAWNERRKSHGPPSQKFCPAGVPSKDRTDITRGDLAGAPAQQSARLLPNFYPVRVPFYSARSKRSFLAILLPTDSHPCTHFLAGPLRPFASPFHVHPMSASSMCGPALLPHHHDRRALQLQITQITLSDLSVRYAWNVLQNLFPSFLLCVRCRALSYRRCLIT